MNAPRSISCCAILSLLAAQFAFAEHTFVFRNWTPSLSIDAPVFNSDGSRLSGTDFVAVLYGGPTVDTLELASITTFARMTPVPFTYVSPGQPGYFARGGGAVVVFGVALEQTPWLQVRAWDARLGSSYDEVAGLGLGGYGESNFFQKRGGELGGLYPSEPLIGLESFSLRPIVPEPSSALLLLVLGLPALLLRRHRP